VVIGFFAALATVTSPAAFSSNPTSVPEPSIWPHAPTPSSAGYATPGSRAPTPALAGLEEQRPSGRPGAVVPLASSFSVVDTLVLNNDSLVPGNFLATPVASQNPGEIAFDSGTNQLFVSNSNSTTVDVISDLSDRVVAKVPDTGGPMGLTYDPGKGEVFVANWAKNTVTIISDATDKVVGTVAVGTNPYWIAYDSGMGQLFVTNYGSNNVSVISDSSDKVVANVPVGSEPYDVVYDPAKGEAFVVNHNASPTTVTVISDATDTVVTSVTIGSWSIGAAFDTAKGEVFATNGPAQATDVVSVISDANNSVVATVNVGDEPLAAAYDPAASEVFVPNSCIIDSCPGTVSVIADASNTVTATIPVGASPIGIAYDSHNGILYACDQEQGTISLIAPQPIYPVVFSESGLAPGAPWTVIFNGSAQASMNSTGPTYVEPNGTYPFQVSPLPGERATPSSGSVVVAGPAAPVSIVFSPVAAPNYAVTFGETGLSTGALWAVTFNGSTLSSTTTTMTFHSSNGTYPYSVPPISRYTSTPSSGTVTVRGNTAAPTIAFAPLPLGGNATYAVTFSETGLPAGSRWSVTLDRVVNASTSPTLGFTASNGSWPFAVGGISGYSATPSSGTVAVMGGPRSVAVRFSANVSATASSSGGILGLPGAEGYVVVGGAVAAVAVAIALGIHSYAPVSAGGIAGGAAARRLRRRKEDRESSETAPPPTKPGSPGAPITGPSSPSPTPPTAAVRPGPPIPAPSAPPTPEARAPSNLPASAGTPQGICSGCGHTFSGTQRFCTFCGRPR
jgi:YVTN family beta-propeller protein